ncbi:hypothetical protein GCM10010172_42660 [Paractinoplanes ferrugineus]|uniref:Uncharacterized protein n=1 Tax=Paractinoplanes ferrugineus TaxID=113564 RepID=A0A919J4C5_9ACTN|nr:hypothetical protein [Actinoplanes ferrugineus]GIE13424.1 hypothetical protein Afe05nite_52640 [Actinoplanes ferrugineus]
MTRPKRADTSALVGRPSWLTAVALLLASLADVGAFSQVVALVLPDQAQYVVYAVVIGMTATAVYLAHTCGAIIRDRATGDPGRRFILWASGGAWAILGLAAFAVRLIESSDPGATSTFYTDGGLVPSDTGHTAVLQAFVFLALYVGTGLTAAAGAYFNRSAVRRRYSAARQRRAVAAERASLSAAAYGDVKAIQSAQQTAYDESAQLLEIEKRAVLALSAELKQYARICIANRGKDPEAARLLFEADKRPYVLRQFDERADPDGANE